jgi:mono/diheme cytochrome c family protein
MTSTTFTRGSSRLPTSQRRTGAVVGLLIGLAAVCHGCHGGDRDDELSLTGGKPRVERREEAPPTEIPGQNVGHRP